MKDELKQAVALFYDGKDSPQISAKGEGLEAEEIIALAKEHNIPLCDNPALATVLSQVEIGDTVPPALYTAVAHIIAFAHQLQPRPNSSPLKI